VALDLSRSMLEVGREREGAIGSPSVVVHRIRADARRPPFPPAAFAEAALLGNTLGFEVDHGEQLLSAVEELVAPGGTLVVEVAPGPGERSRYLARLPPGAVRRLLAAPIAALLPRVQREGFEREAVRHRTEAFRRWAPQELDKHWRANRWRTVETIAVAPALGPEDERVRAVADDPRAWERLLELEEALGRMPERWTEAAAVLLAAVRPASAQTI
jgi:SAM-dependent methyltransferase